MGIYVQLYIYIYINTYTHTYIYICICVCVSVCGGRERKTHTYLHIYKYHMFILDDQLASMKLAILLKSLPMPFHFITFLFFIFSVTFFVG